MDCTVCHDPHTSTAYDRTNALRQQCTDCHADKDMALHAGKVYASGDYTERLSCESCHMPFATVTGTGHVIGDSSGRVGDTRTHIFRINVNLVDYSTFFTSDFSSVVTDGQGRAGVTVDFVCLRCHNTENGFPFRLTVTSASNVAVGMHRFTSN